MIAADHLAAGEGDQDYWRTKIGLARVFGEQVLATASAQEAAVSMGALDLANITAASMGKVFNDTAIGVGNDEDGESRCQGQENGYVSVTSQGFVGLFRAVRR